MLRVWLLPWGSGVSDDALGEFSTSVYILKIRNPPMSWENEALPEDEQERQCSKKDLMNA